MTLAVSIVHQSYDLRLFCNGTECLSRSSCTAGVMDRYINRNKTSAVVYW